MDNQPQNLSRATAIIILVVIVLIIVVGGYLLWKNENQDNNTNKTISNSQLTAEETMIDAKNGFSITVPAGWLRKGGHDDAINIVKFGSPSQIVYFEPQGYQSDIFSPTIDIQTFTIDERLDAKDVVNLIHDQKIAEKIEIGPVQCETESEQFILAGFNAFSFVSDATNELCKSESAEGIVKTVVVKRVGDEHAAMLSLIVSTKDEYQKFLPDFQSLLNSISFKSSR